MQKQMKKCVLELLVLFMTAGLFGCGKKVTEYKNEFLVTANAQIREEEDGKRLVVTVDIDNQKNQEYKNVSYSLTLNKEAQHYIASGILTFEETDKMNVVSSQKAEEMEQENGKLLVTGFHHEWDMFLTTEADLKEYWNLSADGIYDAVKEVTVTITWDGGMQEEVCKLAI